MNGKLTADVKTKRQSSARFREVLDAAVELFYRRGYEGTGLQEIGDSVGLLKGSVYHYIDSKEDLLFAIVYDANIEIDNANDEWRNLEYAADPLEPLTSFMRGHVRATLGRSMKAEVMIREARYLSAERAGIVAKVHERYEEDLRRLIRRAMKEGQLRPNLTVGFAVNVVFAIINRAHGWFKADGSLDPEAFADKVAEYALASLR